jgi:hypothetical protein
MAVIMGSRKSQKQTKSGADTEVGHPLYSIGHSAHGVDRFIELLQRARVTAVADVRSMPASQRYPQFNRPDLEWRLKQEGIAYLFLGDDLGGRPKNPSVYDAEGRVNYEKVRLTAAFQRGLDALCQALRRFAVAMLCAEEDPLDCHRGLMITPALRERGIEPDHLRGDGSIETTAAMETRLLSLTGIGSDMLDGLFAPLIGAEEHHEWLAQAYREQAKRKAFRQKAGERMDPSQDEDEVDGPGAWAE